MNYLEPLILESINLELNVAEIYLFFQNCYLEDKDFWWELAIEEKNHAALLRSGLEYFFPIGEFPTELINESLTELKKANKFIEKLLSDIKTKKPTRAETFQIAVDLEETTAEMHFQKALKGKPANKAIEIFQKLNQADVDHKEKLLAYMSGHWVK